MAEKFRSPQEGQVAFLPASLGSESQGKAAPGGAVVRVSGCDGAVIEAVVRAAAWPEIQGRRGSQEAT